MHFASAFAILALPISILAGVLPPVSKRDTEMTAEEFVTSTGQTRTVYYRRSIMETAHGEVDQPSSSGLTKRFQFFASGEDRNLCGDSSFVSKTSGGSPTVGDCVCLRDFLRSKQGAYSVNRDDPRFDRLATCGTCTFGVDTANFFGTDVGNTDAADVMTSAIDMFQSGGLIGAEGRMGCDNAFQTAGTDWAIFHS